jgi:2-polyprenyl-3-methyl-5-hydroxy-6-metoxy-1,4-benzoquinol methylase
MTIWNERYAAHDLAFGAHPNRYLKTVIDRLPPGKMLVPGAGEGRDAVYAAQLGWDVLAFDLSHVGQQKAMAWAAREGVPLRYEIQDASQFHFGVETFDLVAMVFFHLPPELRRWFFGNLYQAINPGGRVVIEAFNPRQIPYTSGGPKQPEMLFSSTMLRDELVHIEPEENIEVLTTLDEGPLHQGAAEVVRYTGVLKPD